MKEEIQKTGQNEMSFWGHLDVLRWAIIRIGAVTAVFLAGYFIAIPHIFDRFVLGPSRPDFFLYRWLGGFMGGDFSVDIISISVTSQFTTHISTSFWLAAVTVFPYIIYEIWKFISPALYPREKKSVRPAFILSTAMFYLGCAVGYCIVFPFTFRFLAEYQVGSGIVNQISLDSYMSNFLLMIFVMGLVFELPVLAKALSALGLVDRQFLKKYRRHAVVVLLILAAVITPTGDPFTLLVVSVPLYLLYEMAILMVKSNQ